MNHDDQAVKPVSSGGETEGESTPAAASRATEAQRVLTVPVQVDRLNDRWAEYDLYTGRLLVQGKEGYRPTSTKLVLRQLDDPRLVAAVGADYVLFPNEELEKQLDTLAAAQGWARYQDPRYQYQSRDGTAVFLTYLPKDETRGSYQITHGDTVRVGFCARNSIDGSMGFGLDLFTYRGLCRNGSIMQQSFLGSLHSKHTPRLEIVLEHLDQHLAELVQVGEQAVAWYRELARVDLNRQIIDALQHSSIPRKYFPWETDKETKEAIPPVQPMTTWDVYNALTEKIWHNERADPASKWMYFTQVHTELAKVVPPASVGLVRRW
jgi:hypothetical protein